MSKCGPFEPLSPQQVEATAQKLEDLAHRFVQGEQPHDVAKAWHDELYKLYAKGQDSVEKVFQKVVADSKSATDPTFPQITESYSQAPFNGGTTKKLDVFPPVSTGTAYPALFAAIDKKNVFSDAMLSDDDRHARNTPTGRTTLARQICWNEKELR